MGGGQQCAPHAQPRHGIVGFRLRQQPCRFSHFSDARQPGSIPLARAAFRIGRRLTFDGRVFRDLKRRFHERPRPGILRGHALNGLIVPGALGDLVLLLHALAGVQGKEIKRGERDRCAERPVRHTRPEPVAQQGLPGHLGAAGPSGQRRLNIHTRKVRATEDAFSRANRLDGSQFRACGRM